MSLNIGQAFDLVGERKVASHVRVDKHLVRDIYEISLRNRSDESREVFLVEHPPLESKILQPSTPWTRLTAGSIQFDVNLKAGEVKKVPYTVESKE